VKVLRSQPSRIHIAIAGHDSIQLVGFRALLEAQADLELHPADLTATDVLAHADIIILANHPSNSLVAEIQHLKALLPNVRVLVIGPALSEEAVLECVALGARGYMSADATGSELAAAIRVVAGGSIWAPRHYLATLIANAADYFPSHPTTKQLPITGRQKEVLSMLIAGRSNREIADPLGIEERTVKAHVAQLMRRFGVRNRIELSVHAVTHSIV